MQLANKASTRIRENDGMSITKPTPNYYEQASDRLLFRSLTPDDIPLWIPFFDRDDYMRFLGQDVNEPAAVRSQVWIDRQIQRQAEGQYGQLAIIEKASGKFIGLGGIIHRELYDKDELEITYSLLPEFWGKGYARELAKHFMDYAKATNEVTSVISMIHPENEASKKVAFANGLVLSGTAKFLGIPVEIYRFEF